MGSSNYNIANSVLEKRRLAMRAKYFEKQEEINNKIPEVAELTDKINNLGASYAIASLKKNKEEADKIRKEMAEVDIKRSELLKSNGFSRDDLEMKYYCNICKDTGFVNGKTCECMKEELFKQRQNFLTSLSPAPQKHFSDFNLELYPKTPVELANRTTVMPYNQMKKIYDYCYAYAYNFSHSSQSLFMTGNAGLGKTHLACSIGNVCMERGYTVLYSSAQSLFYKIEQSRYSDEDVISDILSCDLFILDDLGAENISSYSLSIFYNIINTRMITNRPCIYTSNITSQTMLQKRYGEKISSRLLGSCQRLPFIGDDIRILKSKLSK